ncbi:Uma2 family endonuclease [Kitasatospora nipponensis]|uniref:Uma2 family endonuclease n=1 Tax=Kitasatospora nipponensis TaxID=258049 RepID=UPI0031E28C35
MPWTEECKGSIGADGRPGPGVPLRPARTTLHPATDNRRPPPGTPEGFEPKPDIVATTHEQTSDNANPFPAGRVLLTVEIVSSDRDGDYAKKRTWYARNEIPLHLIVDPNDGVWELHTQPHAGSYRTVEYGEFGEDVKLPEPLSCSIATATFKVYPPRRLP